jgi:hypothetical protein
MENGCNQLRIAFDARLLYKWCSVIVESGYYASIWIDILQVLAKSVIYLSQTFDF